jgi:Lon protease-like protein
MSDAAPPRILPVFPLTGSLLLPGNFLPLNIFEPRYRAMVEDAMAPDGEPYIGMIQPLVPRQDNKPPMDLAFEQERPELYRVGCAGRIERCEPQSDGRYLILLRGVSRFRVREELDLQRGYRRVVADYAEFRADPQELQAAVDPSRVMGALRGFSEAHGLTFDFDLLGSLPGVSLVNGLAAALPFLPAEKQALLEAAGPAEREELLLALMGMGLEPMSSAGDYYAPPTLH